MQRIIQLQRFNSFRKYSIIIRTLRIDSFISFYDLFIESIKKIFVSLFRVNKLINLKQLF